MTDLISVIVPVYNVAPYLEKCLDSIVNQTYRDLEIIIIDDGSTDDSGSICDRYAGTDQRIKVIHKSNGGLSDARNTGMRVSSGKYYSFVDSDDYLDPAMLETLYSELIKEQADMSICSFKCVNQMKGLGGSLASPIEDLTLSGEKILVDKFFGEGQIYWSVVFNKLYRRELFEGITFPVGYMFEDLFVVPEVMKRCKLIKCISKQLYYYVQREGSILHSDNRRDLDRMIAYLRLADSFSEDRLYSFLIDRFFMRGLGYYKTEFWFGNTEKRKTKLAKKRKKEAEILFRSAWKKNRRNPFISFKKKAYYELHFISFNLVKALHFIFHRD